MLPVPVSYRDSPLELQGVQLCVVLQGCSASLRAAGIRECVGVWGFVPRSRRCPLTPHPWQRSFAHGCCHVDEATNIEMGCSHPAHPTCSLCR